MTTIIFHNIAVFILILLLIFFLKRIGISNLRKSKKLIAKVLLILLMVCLLVFIMFIDAIALGIIGLIPN